MNLVLVLCYQLLGLGILVLFRFKRAFDSVNVLLGNGKIMMLISKSLVLCFDFILELRDLMRCDLELALKLGNFILGLDQVLGIEVTIRTHSLIEVLLLLELAFELDVFLFQFTD